MKKILIPIDFSRASNNAISYAISLGQHYELEQIILVVNVYVTEFEQLIPSADFIQYSLDKATELDEQLKHQFQELKKSLFHKLKKSVRVSFILSKIPFLQSIRNLIKQETPDLLIIGSNHGISGEESYIGDHLIKIAKNSTIPVLIIPELTRYQPLRHALVPFNFSNVPTVDLIRKMDRLKSVPHPELYFLNVESTDASPLNGEPIFRVASELGSVIEHHKCFYFDSAEKDILKGINQFSLEHDFELIVALPGEHSFLYKLTHRNIIKALARNNYKPVLILKNLSDNTL